MHYKTSLVCCENEDGQRCFLVCYFETPMLRIVDRSLNDAKQTMDTKLECAKRKRVERDEEHSDENTEHKPLCKYGEKCYQKNSYHLKKFRHPHRDCDVKPEEDLHVTLLCIKISAIQYQIFLIFVGRTR